MRKWGIIAIGMLAACSSEPPPAEVEAARSLMPGEYAMTSTVAAFRPSEGATPASKAKVGDMLVTKACVAADGTIDPAIFAEAGDTCKAASSYVSDGRMSLQLSCTRPGAPGQIMSNVDGEFTADHFEGTATTTTYLTGPGDYVLTRTISAKRIGECPAAAAAKS